MNLFVEQIQKNQVTGQNQKMLSENELNKSNLQKGPLTNQWTNLNRPFDEQIQKTRCCLKTHFDSVAGVN